MKKLFGEGKNAVNVFVPSTPNPATGFFVVVPENEVVFLDMSIEEGMKLAVSGGAMGLRKTEEEIKEEEEDLHSF